MLGRLQNGALKQLEDKMHVVTYHETEQIVRKVYSWHVLLRRLALEIWRHSLGGHSRLQPTLPWT